MANIGSPHLWKILEIMNEELPYGLDLIRLEPRAPTPSTCKCFQIGEGLVILLTVWIIGLDYLFNRSNISERL